MTAEVAHQLLGIHIRQTAHATGSHVHRRAITVIGGRRLAYWEHSEDGRSWEQCFGHLPPEPRTVELVPMAGCSKGHAPERMRAYLGAGHQCLDCERDGRKRRATTSGAPSAA